MSTNEPFFTIVVPTYNRGAHILATLLSGLKQSFDDFELLVIGDACTDQTGTIVTALGDPRVRWINLDSHWGVQSGPNNRGIQEARGQVIAYLGHDDIWEPDHLANHAAIYRQTGVGVVIPDVVASGVLLHEGKRGGVDRVLGMISNTESEVIDFVPPTGLSHTRKIALQSPAWPKKDETGLPVDSAFQEGLLAQGVRFTSTGKISAHKFVSTTRYLSYVAPSSFEQTRLLRLIRNDDHQAWLQRKIAQAKTHGRFMDGQHTTDGMTGARAKEWSDHIRGVTLPDVQTLGDDTITITQDDGPRGFDWRPLSDLSKSHHGIRWTGPSNRPKMLIPVGSPGKVKLDLALRCTDSLPPENIEFVLNGKEVTPKIKEMAKSNTDGPTHQMLLRCELRTDTHSVLEMIYAKDAMQSSSTGPWVGVGVGRMRITKVNAVN